MTSHPDSSLNITTEPIVVYDLTPTVIAIRLVSYFLQLLSYILLVYVLVKKSPPAMGTYKWYILVNSTHAIFMRVFDVFCQPFRISTNSISLSYGLCRHLHPSQLIATCVMYFDYLLFTGFMYTLSTQFIFRYLQTANIGVKVFSNMYLYFVGYLLFQSAVTILQFLTYHVYIWVNGSDVNANHNAFSSNPNASVIIGFNVTSDRGHLLSFKQFFSLLPMLIALFSVIASYWILIRVKTILDIHPATKQLYIKLLHVLVIDVLLLVLLGFLPSLFYLFVESGTLISKFLSLVPEFYPIAVNIILLVYIKPYRDFVLIPFTKCTKQNSIQSINSNTGQELLPPS